MKTLKELQEQAQKEFITAANVARMESEQMNIWLAFLTKKIEEIYVAGILVCREKIQVDSGSSAWCQCGRGTDCTGCQENILDASIENIDTFLSSLQKPL